MLGPKRKKEETNQEREAPNYSSDGLQDSDGRQLTSKKHSDREELKEKVEKTQLQLRCNGTEVELCGIACRSKKGSRGCFPYSELHRHEEKPKCSLDRKLWRPSNATRGSWPFATIGARTLLVARSY